MTLKCLEMADGGRGDTEGCLVRPHAASCGLESESLFESLSCETRLIPEEYGGCDQSLVHELLGYALHGVGMLEQAKIAFENAAPR